MDANKHFNAGDSREFVPQVDTAHQAVHALRGYAYQCLAAALEWVDISEYGRLYLEVAEDYAVLADYALRAIQVKDTKESGAVTLNSTSVRKAITAFVDLVEKNPEIDIDLHFMTTSKIGQEQIHTDRPAGKAGLTYWKEVAAGADVKPLRAILECGKFGKTVSGYCEAREDTELRDSLIRKIHWNCGNPDFATLRKELESRLVVIGRDKFKLHSANARQLADRLLCQVLQTSIIVNPGSRVLTRADFYKLIDAETRESIPRDTYESLLQQASKFASSIGEQESVGETGSVVHTDLFINGNTLPDLRKMIPRRNVEPLASIALKEHGTCVLVGGSGVGKSVVARRIAAQKSCDFFIVECRDMKAVETQTRLNSVFSRIGGLPTSTLILDDLNHLDDRNITLALGQVIESVQRRGRGLLVTCHRSPSPSTLSTVGLDQTCVVNCPYFTEEEVLELVDTYGGDPDIWGRMAYLAGHLGLPQLTHAFVDGISGRGWPIEEYSNIMYSGLSSEDIDTVRSSIRLSLVRDLSESTRKLLYRLSLIVGHFKKSFALSIASISPEVPQAGECMDQLVGPWIEASGKDRYRISPLVSGIGREMLTMEKRKCIHKTITEEFFRQGKIDALDVDTITIHALAAEWDTGLALIADMVLSTDSGARGVLAEHAMLLRFFRTNYPIYPNNQAVSTILRLAQFALAVATEEQSDVSGIVAALFNEIDTLPPSELKIISETHAFMQVNLTLGIANQVDNWVHILARSIRIVEQNENVRGFVAGIEGVTAEDNSIFFGQIFGVGSSNLTSVKRLEIIIEQLDEINKRTRNLFLTPIDKGSSDYSVFVNMPWVTEQYSENFDAVDAEARYARMAEKTLSWNIRSLTAQCWVARSIILNEFLNEKEKSLSVLEEAVELLGQDLILNRARASVHWHQGEHEIALEIYRSIAEYIGEDSSVERTFALREAAISAAKCSEWLLAEKWFLDGQQAAICLDSNEMFAMAIGLCADAAVAALRAGKPDRALAEFTKIIYSLASIEADDTIAAAYCHRVIRHAILWVSSYIEGTSVEVGGQPIKLEPGTCSNPDPLPEIRELPLGHIDCAWYILAESEVSANIDVDICSSLNKRLTEGTIPQLELALRMKIIQRNISSLNATGFAEHFTKFIETTVHCSKNIEHLTSAFDAVAPTRENIPTLDSYTSVDPMIEQVAKEAVLGFGIHTIMADQSEAFFELETALADYFGNFFPGKSVFDYLNDGLLSLTGQDLVVAERIKNHLRNGYFAPREFYLVGLRFFEWINQSRFRDSLMLPLANWLRSGWNRIVEQERFQIFNPLITVPPVVECLENSRNDRSFVTELLLVSSDAAGVRLSSEYRNDLIAMNKANH